jgi:uncharacterized protein
MTPPSWRTALAEYIQAQALPREKYGHQVRLYQLTRTLGEGLTYDDDIVYAAAWLHDLGVFLGHRPRAKKALAAWDSVAYSLEKSPGLLQGFGFPEAKIDPVLEAIRNHQPTGNPQSLEATILRDADILEQLGAVGIVRTICKVGRDTRFDTFTPALPSQLRLATSRRLAEERVKLHRAFLHAVSSEAGPNLL